MAKYNNVVYNQDVYDEDMSSRYDQAIYNQDIYARDVHVDLPEYTITYNIDITGNKLIEEEYSVVLDDYVISLQGNKSIVTDLSFTIPYTISTSGTKTGVSAISSTLDYTIELTGYVSRIHHRISLDSGSILEYDIDIPSEFTHRFCVSIGSTFDGEIATLLNTATSEYYTIGYENSTERFYTDKDGVITYSNVYSNLEDYIYMLVLRPDSLVVKEYEI